MAEILRRDELFISYISKNMENIPLQRRYDE